MTLQSNILVISDLHLGDDLNASASPATTRTLEVLARQLVQFLAHYTRRRSDGRPWRLVINGDMVDFLTVCMLPGEGDLELAGDEVTPEEHVYGLGRRPRVAAAKMRAVVARHTDVFTAMASFLAVGNSVEIIAGNHDAEFHFPAVQKALRDEVAAIWAAMPLSRRAGAPTPDDVKSRMRFHPWFFYEEGVAWIEHGHQYDECSSFDYALDIMDPGAPGTERIATNVDVAGLRYVTNRIHGAESSALAEWNFAGYLRFSFGLGLRGLARIAKGYGLFVWSLLSVWRTYRPGARVNRVRGEAHLDRLREHCARWKLSESSLRAIGELRRRPVVSNLNRLVSVLMLDTLAINVVGLALMVLALLVLPWFAGIPVAVALYLAKRQASRWAEGRRGVDAEAVLALMPERIRRQVKARYVVFGHTHEPVAQPLGDGGMYFNTGTWVPAGKPGLLRVFTHVVIRNGADGAHGELCQWRDGSSRAFTPGWAPEAAPVAVRPESPVAVVLQPSAATSSVTAPA